MKYNNVSKLAKNVFNLKSTELQALCDIWNEKKGELEQSNEYQEFIKKLQREWAIETGIIERLYTWDRGVTELLIEQGIDSSLISHKGGLLKDEAENVKILIDDQYNIVEGLFSYVKGEQPLNEHFIRSIHAEFTKNQETTIALTSDGKKVPVKLLKGEYKKQENNPRRPDGEMHFYCPPELVRDEMENLVKWYAELEDEVPPEILSAWLHHRFTQIHPFQDGNGRVARALATLVFLRKGLFPLVIRDQERREYIEALESADEGKLEFLIKLFVKRQRDAILSAMEIQKQVEQSKHSEQIISTAITALKNKYKAQRDKLNDVYIIAKALHNNAVGELDKIGNVIDKQLQDISLPGKKFFANTFSALNDDLKSHYYHYEIIQIANKFDYFANFDNYKSYIRLIIQTEKRFEFIISFHGYGQSNNGIMAATSFTSQRIPKDEPTATELVNVQPGSPDLFQFNYAETQDNTLKRFHDWLESTITVAMAEWNKSINL
ncbi:MAG: Fic family protein [Leptospirales bacterium]